MKRTFTLWNWHRPVVGHGRACGRRLFARAVYFGLEGQTVTAARWTGSSRTWTPTLALPRGLARESNTKIPMTRTSKYGSVVTTIYEALPRTG